jgi:hypothetical protein
MTVDCSECLDDVFTPAIEIIQGERKEDVFIEEKGFVACFSHFRNAYSQINSPKIRSLQNIPEGRGYMLTEILGEHPMFTRLQHSEKTQRSRVLGYLSPKEALKYFPNTLKEMEKP